MEAGSLTFTTDEFVVLETVEFDEDVQREERVRFYTFDEQQTDAYEQLIPQGRTTQYQRNAIRDLLHRYKELYDAHIVPTDTSYELRGIRKRGDLPWIHPVTPNTREFVAYSWDNWARLVETPSYKTAGWYPRMVSGMPRITLKDGLPLTKTTEFVDPRGSEHLRVLPAYELTRTQMHSDRTFDVIRVPVDGTSDRIPTVGYFLDARTLDIPNPLPDHPFLSTTESRFLESTAPIEEVIPSMGAVLEHGVPVTNDPYEEAMPYLKLYDVRLQDIPWSIWRSKFPPVEEFIPDVEVPPIPFPKSDAYAPPSDKVLEIYGTEYRSGLSVREWLMRQDDGGEAVVRALLSKSIDNGSVQSVPGIDLPIPAYPNTTVEDCRLLVGFEDFKTKGLFRRTWKWDSKKDTDTIITVCVPVEFIRQERAKAGYLNRKAWKEGKTADEIFKSRLDILRTYRFKDIPDSAAPEPPTPAREPSPLRADVMIVLNDPRRIAADKLRDIRDLIVDTTHTGNIHSDAEGRFVVCEHTLAILEGELEKDRRAFYDKWTVKEDGFRVCTSCGEQINNDDFVDETEYNEEGFIVRSSEALETGPTFFTKGFVTGIKDLAGLFDQTRAADRILFWLISLLQVLPDEKQLNPLLTLVHGYESLVKSNSKKGAIGILFAIILFQTHQPQLIPRRSFGPKPVKLSGYPRDSPKAEPYSIVDSLMGVLRKTFEDSPSSIKGPEADVIRDILTNPGDVKKDVYGLLPSVLKRPDIKEKFASVKVEVPTVEEPKTLIPQLLPPKELGIIVGYSPCPSTRPILPGLLSPLSHKTDSKLRSPLYSSPRGVSIKPSLSIRIAPAVMAKSDIQTLVKPLAGIKTNIKIEDQYRRNLSVASRLADLSRKPLSIRTVDPTQKESELRDISRGFLAKAIVNTENVDKLRLTDVSLYTLLSKYTDEKKSANKVRADERLAFVAGLAKKSDTERMIDGELLRIGLAPYIMTLAMREDLAAAAFERRIEEMGVGGPRDYEDQGETSNAGADNGDYGDYVANPSNDGRDHQQPSMTDDPLLSI